MTENKRFFKIMYDYDWWFVFDKKQEYIETECPTPHTKASDLIPMTEEQVIELLNENEELKKENKQLKKLISKIDFALIRKYDNSLENILDEIYSGEYDKWIQKQVKRSFDLE